MDMPARKLPPTSELQRLVRQGWTHQQIADWVQQETGQQVGRTAISAALHRAGLTDDQLRYKDVAPWTVHSWHQQAYPLLMLRTLGRRMQGQPLGRGKEQRLDSWLRQLSEENLVVGYAPHTASGFVYVTPRPGVDGEDGIPIRRDVITERQLPADV